MSVVLVLPRQTGYLRTGFMLPNEENVINNIKTPYNKFFVPLVWASAVVTRARKEGRIKDDFAVKTLIDVSSFYAFRFFLSVRTSTNQHK